MECGVESVLHVLGSVIGDKDNLKRGHFVENHCQQQLLVMTSNYW